MQASRATGKIPVQFETRFKARRAAAITNSIDASATRAQPHPSSYSTQQPRALHEADPRTGIIPTPPLSSTPFLVPYSPTQPIRHQPRRDASSALLVEGTGRAGRRGSVCLGIDAVGVDVAGSPRPGGGGSRVVRFDAVLKLILVPSRNDLKELSPELWYSEEDYLEFRIGALQDMKRGVWKGIKRRRTRNVPTALPFNPALL